MSHHLVALQDLATTGTPTAPRRSAASLSPSTTASRWASWAPTGRANRPCCCTSPASSVPERGTVRVGDLAGDAGDAGRGAAHSLGMVFQDPDDQLFMPTVEDDVAFGPAESGPALTRWSGAWSTPWSGWAHSHLRERPALSPVRRREAGGGHRHRAGHGPGHPGHGRAQRRPGSGLRGGG